MQVAQDPQAGIRAALYTALAPLQEDVQDALDDEDLLGPDLMHKFWDSPRVRCLLWQLCYCPLAGPAWELLAGTTRCRAGDWGGEGLLCCSWTPLLTGFQ